MKQRVIILLLGVCMIATLVVGCGNSKNKETEKENESEVVTEIESELVTEIESKLIETEVETETTELQDAETKVDDTTSSEQTANKPSSDKGQSGSGSSSNKPQNNNGSSNNQNNNSSSSDRTWTDGEGNVLSTNPALCSHVNSKCYSESQEVIGDIVVQYDTGAYERETSIVYTVSCTWCNFDMGQEVQKGNNIQYLDKVTDYIGEYKRVGKTGYLSSKWDIFREEAGHAPYNIFYLNNTYEIGGEMVKYVAGKIDSVDIEIDINTDDYIIKIDTFYSNGAPQVSPLYDEYVNGTRYKDLCTMSYIWGNTGRGICIYIFANLPG